MKLYVECEAREGYLYVKALGRFEHAAAREVFHAWVEEAHRNELDRILCDVTRVEGIELEQLSIMDRFDIMAYVSSKLPSGFRLAILALPQQQSKDKFEENVMVNRGAQVRVTADPEEAFKWLGIEALAKAVNHGR